MTEEQIRAIVREELAKTGGATSHSRRDTDHEPIQDADVRESLQVFHSGDAANLRIARIGDGYSDADMENPEAYLRRGGVIGNIEWYGGHRGETGWWHKLAYPNGADGRVASIYCDAEEDFGERQAATISFATTRAGQSPPSRLATRMQVRHDGRLRILEEGHDETSAAGPPSAWPGPGRWPRRPRARRRVCITRSAVGWTGITSPGRRRSSRLAPRARSCRAATRG
jgi:hypothetical protein